jgi:hypothetical protein
MTRTKEQLRKAVFAKLQGLRRKLLARGVPCTYARSVLAHDNGGSGFTITCGVAGGQATLLPQIVVRTAEGTQSYDHLTFDQGLDRLKELFQGDCNSSEAASSNGQATDRHEDESDGSGAVGVENQTQFGQEGDGK